MAGSILTRIFSFTFALAVSASVPALADDREDARHIEHGKGLVELNCGPCHGVGKTDKSPHPQAPEFRTLGERYPVDALEEAFAEGIVTGHPDMPEFEATPDQISDIIAYLASIQY